ncbi:MAG TPA: 3-hydroxybutyryl-CoA dehydrogenase, partial [Chloroflexi bacterium]|nr:3-hydroxybutyryl-CoA dehydrogenase [Chloroflexota bacterium]
MGGGIAQLACLSGARTLLHDPVPEALQSGIERIRKHLDRGAARGRWSEEEASAAAGRLEPAARLEDLAPCELVIEAAPERLELKRELFSQLGQGIVSEACVLATNTSSLLVTAVANGVKGPERVVGMHFFNPAPVLKLVEVVRTVVTEQEVVEDIKVLADRLGKVPVVIGDKAGFIANALLFGYLNHAVSMFESHYATREDIDAAMRLGCGYPMGPLALLDLIGLDTAYEILD